MSAMDTRLQQQLQQQLQNGLRDLELALSDSQQQQMLDYIDLIARWNKTHNLTSIDDVESMLSKHLLDSLAISPWVDQPRLLDVGTGAGLPAIPLAIANPELECTALDASHKRIVFIRQVIRELAIDNVTAVHGRVEDCRVEDFQGEPFPLICSRAFSSLEQFTGSSQHLLADGGRWLAMKGQRCDDETSALSPTVCVEEEHELQVPQLQASRRLLVLARR